MNHLRFWENAPPLSKPDHLFLPVDAVIKEIFKHLDPSVNSFEEINKALEENGSMEIWDDLWFWGFITQKGSKGSREFVFNKGKYWLLLFTPKDSEAMKDIEARCKKFIDIIQGKQN